MNKKTIAEQAKQLEEMAEAIRVKDALLSKIAKQTPEKPDYWSSCGQCERNISDAEEALTAPPYPEILAARDRRVAEAIAHWIRCGDHHGVITSADVLAGKWREYL